MDLHGDVCCHDRPSQHANTRSNAKEHFLVAPNEVEQGNGDSGELLKGRHQKRPEALLHDGERHLHFVGGVSGRSSSATDLRFNRCEDHRLRFADLVRLDQNLDAILFRFRERHTRTGQGGDALDRIVQRLTELHSVRGGLTETCGSEIDGGLCGTVKRPTHLISGCSDLLEGQQFRLRLFDGVLVDSGLTCGGLRQSDETIGDSFRLSTEQRHRSGDLDDASVRGGSGFRSQRQFHETCCEPSGDRQSRHERFL